MRIENEIQLDFDDVLIRPKRSQAGSRRDVDLIRSFKTLHGNEFTCVPIVAANMWATGTVPILNALALSQMLTAMHKFYTIPELLDIWNRGPGTGFYSLGIRDEDFTKLKQFILAGSILPGMVCLDAANGHTMFFVDKVKKLRKMLPESIIMAGNVCIPEATQELLLAGADIVKLGIGPGAACTTRKITGVGRPQLSTIIDCSDVAHGLGGLTCADGGCRTPGDIAKAFGAGADLVMLGSMLAGTDESNGKHGDGTYEFFGMSSKEAQERFYGGGVPEYAAAEGQSLTIPARGPVVEILRQIKGGLRSTCTYTGANKLKDLSKCTTFVRVK